MRYLLRLTAALAIAASTCGCEAIGFLPGRGGPEAPPVTAERPAEADCGQARYLAKTAVAADATPADQGAVDVALEWSRKYASAAEQLLEAQRVNKDLANRNETLAGKVAGIERQRDDAQKELKEANEMLAELGKELREWKTNVLGFQGDIMKAHKAELQAIRKVLILLGGEVVQPTTASTDKQAARLEGARSDLLKGPKG